MACKGSDKDMKGKKVIKGSKKPAVPVKKPKM